MFTKLRSKYLNNLSTKFKKDYIFVVDNPNHADICEKRSQLKIRYTRVVRACVDDD